MITRSYTCPGCLRHKRCQPGRLTALPFLGQSCGVPPEDEPFVFYCASLQDVDPEEAGPHRCRWAGAAEGPRRLPGEPRLCCSKALYLKSLTPCERDLLPGILSHQSLVAESCAAMSLCAHSPPATLVSCQLVRMWYPGLHPAKAAERLMTRRHVQLLHVACFILQSRN